MKRYVCPRECGNNLLAPNRMASDDVRRFCLPCSEETGKLVERICPARERKKARKAEARREQAKAERARERERTAHLRQAKKDRRKAARLKVWETEGLKMRPEWLEIRDGKLGHGRAGRTGWVVAGRDSTATWNALVIVHELTHICLYRLRHVSKWKGHGRAFRGIFLAAACEFFGIDKQEVKDAWQAILDANSGRIRAYDLDSAVYRVVTGEEPKPVWSSHVMTDEAKDRAATKAQRRRERQADYQLARAYVRHHELDVGEVDSEQDAWQRTRPMAQHVVNDGRTLCTGDDVWTVTGAGTLVTCKRCLAKIAKRAKAEGFTPAEG